MTTLFVVLAIAGATFLLLPMLLFLSMWLTLMMLDLADRWL